MNGNTRILSRLRLLYIDILHLLSFEFSGIGFSDLFWLGKCSVGMINALNDSVGHTQKVA
ncbi:MAG: hypothetical protein COA78_29560 [Blastopirellula sp.]|nr:MAG: hypothetical protein COA78_29560 [Blastopirellula sp.]